MPVADPPAAARALRSLAQAGGLLGAVTLAPEGISGAVAGSATAVAAFEDALRRGRPAPDGWPALPGLAFKHSACGDGLPAPFGRLQVGVKPELVALGLGRAGQGLPAADERDASHLDPLAWRAWLRQRTDAVLLDNRNHFEWRLGRFKGAADPQVDHFSGFVDTVRAQAPQWRAAGRPVAMYCTGGIRCDKTAPWLRSLGLQVLQLQGGVLAYFEALQAAGLDPAEDWQGSCFVFDRRLALDTQLQPAGLSADQVFDPQRPDEAWRLARARQLAGPR